MKGQLKRPKYDFCFRRWTRKSYSVFNSLHKIIKIGVMVFSCNVLILRPQFSFAQVTHVDTLSEKEVLLEDFVVKSTSYINVHSMAQITTVITRSEIEQAAVNSLQDLLTYIQGVDIRARGNNGVQADVSLRGGTFDQVVVLLNGINITDPQTGHHSLNIPVPIEVIERIEVIEGPSTLLYNTIGFTGCINIVTKNSEDNQVDMSLGAGMYGFIRASSTNFIRINKWRFTLSGDINKSDGFTENTDYLQGNAFFRLVYEDKKKGSFDLQGGFQQKNFGANSFYSARYKEQYEQTRVFLTNGTYSLSIQRWIFLANVYVRNHYDHFQLFRYEAPNWYTGHNNHQTLIIGANAKVAYQYKRWFTIFGIDFRQERLLSNTLGEPLLKLVPVSFVEDTAFYSKYKMLQHFGFQLQTYLAGDKYKTSLGGKIDVNNDYGVNGYLGWDGTFLLPKKLELNCFVQNVYRLPTFTDLYYNSPTQVSDPNLQPEQALAMNINLVWKPKEWRTDITFFYRYGFRIIDWVRLSSEEQWTCQNTTHVQAMGTDVSAAYFPQKSYITQVRLQYCYLFAYVDAQDYHSLYATDYLRNQLKLSIYHRIAWKFYAGWQFNFQDRAGTYMDINTNKEESYKPYLLCNVKISLKLERGNIFLEVNNLFNRKYIDLGNIPQPGIWIKGGISVNIL